MKKKRRTSSKIYKIPYRACRQAGRDKFREGGAPMLYAGIDARKRACTIVIIDDQGKKIKEGNEK